MKKTALTLAAVIAAGVLHAELLMNPDENTLWMENGKEIKTQTGNAGGGWNNTLKYTPLEEGKGFIVEYVDKPTGGCYMNVSSEYPWFVFEIASAEIIPKKYVGNSFGGSGFNYGVVNKIFPGIYAFNIYDNTKIPAKGQQFIRADQHGCKITYTYMKMVKEPENFIKIDSEVFAAKKSFSKGDKLNFTVKLKDPAADVVLSFFHSYTMPKFDLGAGPSLQLKQDDKDGKIWKGELTVGDLPAKPAVGASAIMVKAEVTGGTLALPLWTNIPYAYAGEIKK